MEFEDLCFETSPGGTTQQYDKEEDHEGPKRPTTIFDPQTLGRLRAQEAPKWAPSGAQAGALGLKQGYEPQWILKSSGFDASQGGPKQQDEDEMQHEGP